MELAALLAVGLGDWVDFGVILGILALNAFVGFYQEKQAADVVASLKGDIAMKATVIRDGKEQQILARELVPGDIVSETCPNVSLARRPLSLVPDGTCHGSPDVQTWIQWGTNRHLRYFNTNSVIGYSPGGSNDSRRCAVDM